MGIIFKSGFKVVAVNVVIPTATPTPTPTPTPTITITPSPTPTNTPSYEVLLMEDGFNLLQEDNYKIIL
jgi:hypothetical protein